MWLATCWVPLVYTLKRIVNHKDVISITGYKHVDSDSGTQISLNNLNVINDVKNDYARMKLTFNMNNQTFVYCVLSSEFSWPVEDSYEFAWIKRAHLIYKENTEIETETDVTDLINMYSGPQRNFYNSQFDFNWIPEIANSNAVRLELYDNNDFCYKIMLDTNTEVNDTGENGLLENICGLKLYDRSTFGFENM